MKFTSDGRNEGGVEGDVRRNGCRRRNGGVSTTGHRRSAHQRRRTSIAAVSSFLAAAGANIVSLDQHATEQSGGTFMQRTIFHLPGLTAARDALERDFRGQV